MNSRDAKDFIVRQTIQQAALEGIPVSDVERRMLYFTEGNDALEDPGKLNSEFESECDSTAYETKISRLMQNAYSRLKKEDPQSLILWDQSVDALLEGDHYLLVLWEKSALSRVSVAAVVKLLAKVLIPIGFFVTILTVLRKYFGSLSPLGSYLFFSLLALVILMSVLRAVSPCKGNALFQHAGMVIVKYLIGRKGESRVK